VTWKQEIQLRDLDLNQSIEITCNYCNRTYYEQPSILLKQGDSMRYVYLNEIEKRLFCRYRGCNGSVKIALINDTETEGFSGGLP